MNNPKPEHRIAAVEKRVTHIEGAIEEMASDQAEELKAIRQDIEKLDDDMKSSFLQIGDTFQELGKNMDQGFEEIKATMATKEDLSKLRDEIKGDIAAMEGRLVDTIKQLWQQKPSE